jgi:hypothetical protein
VRCVKRDVRGGILALYVGISPVKGGGYILDHPCRASFMDFFAAYKATVI